LKANYQIPYFQDKDTSDGVVNITLSEHVSFLNKPSLQKMLNELPPKSKVVIDGSKSQTIDYDALYAIHRFKEIAKEKNIQLELKNIPDLEVSGDLH
jgi:MFS superfamily sulfate permease-like transporter